MEDQGSVCVIIPAYNAAATVADAVRTALAEPEVAQVIVVDDASTDSTAETARVAADSDPRLTVIRCAVNGGPAAARNLALNAARARWVAVVDSDDFVLPGRFARLLETEDCDLVADNILFVDEDTGPEQCGKVEKRPEAGVIDIDLQAFVRANLPGDSDRGEWGFLKPVIRREFLDRHRLSYDEDMRLGEDYDLYVRMLLNGARFRVLLDVGYVARWREDSLSAQHRTSDLRALASAACRHLDFPAIPPKDRAALEAQRDNIRQRYLLREFLDRRALAGRIPAVLTAISNPDTLLPIARGVIGDKLAARRPAAARSRIGRVLIEDDPASV